MKSRNEQAICRSKQTYRRDYLPRRRPDGGAYAGKPNLRLFAADGIPALPDCIELTPQFVRVADSIRCVSAKAL